MNRAWRMSFATAVGAGLVICAAMRQAEAQNYVPRTLVTHEEIGQAIASELRARLPKESPTPAWDVDVPLAVPAAGSHKLRVTSVCREADTKLLRFQLACIERAACLPFLTWVHTSQPVPAAPCSGATTGGSLPAPTAIVEPGRKVMAVLAVTGVRMTAPVTCLERGAMGDVIFVRGQEGRAFRARVAGPAFVEALPQ